MECVFCTAPVQFDQQTMAYRISDRDEPEHRWWLCRDCAEIRSRGERTEGLAGARGTCIECEEPAAYTITVMKQTPRGDIQTDDTVFDVLCESHFEGRAT